MFSRVFRNFTRVAGVQFARHASTFATKVNPRIATGIVLSLAAACPFTIEVDGSSKEYIKKVRDNEAKIRQAIADILECEEPKENEEEHYGPVFVRLAWHAAGTFDVKDGSGGSTGCTMRFKPESDYGANAGLGVARDRLELVKKQFPFISYADLYTLAGIVAIEEMGGPVVPFRPGRSDFSEKNYYKVEDGRLPDASQGSQHIRDIFYRMGFNDQEIVALIGAHAVGRCHKDRSGYHGPWTRSPTTFANTFYKALLEEDWKWTTISTGKKQFVTEDGLMMLPADMALITDPEFAKWVKLYANDDDKFQKDFAVAFAKLLDNGVNFIN